MNNAKAKSDSAALIGVLVQLFDKAHAQCTLQLSFNLGRVTELKGAHG